MKRLILVLVMVFGVCGFAQTTLTVTSIGQYEGNEYKLIYDEDHDLTCFDYTYNSTGWDDAVDWADNLLVEFGGVTYDDWGLPTAYNPDGSDPGQVDADPIPEPEIVLLLGLGLAVFAVLRRRRRYFSSDCQSPVQTLSCFY